MKPKSLLVLAAVILSAAVCGAKASADESTLAANTVEKKDVQKIQSLSYKEDASVRDALNFLAMKYHKNIIPSTNVNGKVNVSALYDVTFEEALDAILGYEYCYEQEGNFIKVYTKDEYQKVRTSPERMEVKVFRLYYITSEEAASMITPVVSSSAVIQTSSLAETGLSSGDAVEVDEGGNSMSQFDTLVVKDYPENLEKIESLIKELDTRPVQVLVEATIMTANLTEDLELGVDINMLNGGTITSVADVAAGVTGTPLQTTGFSGTDGNKGIRIGVSSGNVSAFITALESVTDTTILANPKILALNKQVGTVFIGQKLGYRSSTTVSASGNASEGEVKFLDSGTKLSFRPYVGNDGYIRMDIYPKESTATFNKENNVPDETTAELATNIMVKDGQTIVIGGLFRDNVTSTKSQVPLLGDIPLFGALFRSTNDSSGRQEVIILLTCHIIEKPHEVLGDKRREDVAVKREGSVDGVQPIAVTRLAEDGYRRAAKFYDNGDKAAAMKELNKALTLRPTYLEALRLKERIILECSECPDRALERIVIDRVEEEDSEYWLRR